MRVVDSQRISILLVAAATFAASAGNYVLNLVAAHRLTASEFGAVGSLLGLLAIIGTLGVAGQALIVRNLGMSAQGNGESAISTLAPRLLLLSSVAVIALAIPVSVLLRIPLLPSVLALITIPIGTATALLIGLLQGMTRFRRLALVLLFAGLWRALFGVIGVAISDSLLGFTVGLVIGSMVGLTLSYFIARQSMKSISHDGDFRWSDFVTIFQALVLLLILTNVDVLLARVLLSPYQSGVYAAGSLVTKIAFFLPSPILIVLYPAMTRSKNRKAVYTAVGATGLVGAIVCLACAAQPGLVTKLIAGPDLAAVSSYLVLFALGGTLLAIVQVTLYARLAVNDNKVVWLLGAGVVILIASILIFGSVGIGNIILLVIVVSAVIGILGLWMDRNFMPERSIL